MSTDQQRVVQLEEKLKLLQDVHEEEKNEMKDKIAELEGGGLADRLAKLELWMENQTSLAAYPPNQTAGGSRHISGESGRPLEIDDDGETVKGREQQLTLTFGSEDTLPGSLERFLSHYELVNEINQERGVRVWTKPSYRALMLRMALRGPAADYLEQEARMLSPWVKDDILIIERLRARYVKNAAVELHIIAFETAAQKEGEPLGEYMVRLQKLIENAYTEHPAFIKQGRVVWQFLNGARDKDVRETLIKEGWMKDSKVPREYEEILKMAEAVVNTKKASRATGRLGSSQSSVGNVNSIQVQPEGRTGQYNQARGSKKRSTSGGGRGGRNSNSSGNWYCYCCKTTEHSGGWKLCPKFRRENPHWKVGDPTPVF